MTGLLRKKKDMMLCMGLIFLALCVVPGLPCGAAEEEPLRVVYNPGVVPMKYVNSSGGAAGMLPDIWRAIGSELGRPVEFIRAQDFDESLDMIKTGRADIHAGLFRTPERETWLTYTSTRLCQVDYFIFTNPLILPVTHLEELSGIQVGITKGGYTQNYVEKRVPDSMVKVFDTYDQLFDAAVRGEIKAFVAQDTALFFYLNTLHMANPFQYKPSVPLYTQTYFGAALKNRPGSAKLIDQVSFAAGKLDHKERQAIQDKWNHAGSDQIIPPEFAARLSDRELAYLKKKRKIVVTNEEARAPFNFNENGMPMGFSVDYLRLLGQKAGIAIHFDTGRIWEEDMEQVKTGGIDLICDFTKTPERERNFTFTALPYLSLGWTCYIRKDGPAIRGVRDLDGKKMAVPKGFFINDLLKGYPRITPVVVEDSTDAILAVSRAKADIGCDFEPVFHHITRQNQVDNLVGIGRLDIPLDSRIPLYLAASKNNSLLINILDKAMQQVTEDEITGLARKWLGSAQGSPDTASWIIPQTDRDVAMVEGLPIILSAEERSWLKKNHTVRISVGTWPPFHYFENDVAKGLSIAYVSVIFKAVGLIPEFVPFMNWSEALESMARGEAIDLIPSIGYTDERAQWIYFTEPYLSFPIVIFTRKDEPFLRSLADLKKKTVAVEKNFNTHHFLENDFPDIPLAVVDTSRQALEMVSSGEADAYVGNLATGTFLIDRHGFMNLKVAGQARDKADIQHMGVRKDWPELVSIINKSLAAMTDEQHQQIRQKAFAMRFEYGIDMARVKRIAAWAGGGMVLVALILFFWIRSLSGEIKKRRQIQQELTKLSRAMEQSPVAVMITDKKGFIEYVNPGFTQMTGYDAAEVIGNNPRMFKSDKTPAARHKNLWETILSGRIWRGELLNIAKTGEERWEAVSISSIVSDSGGITHFVAVKEDITSHKQMVKEINGVRKKAEAATRVKSDFLANMSHEIRTPMNAILGMSHLALRTGLTDKQFEYVSKIDESARRLLGIINDILDFSKIEAGRLQIESVPFLMDQVLQTVSDTTAGKSDEKGLELVFAMDPGLPDGLMGDPLRLGQVLINLVGNAVKFTEKGEVQVTSELLETGPDHVCVKFRVTDTGIGLTPDQQDRLFQAFSQADATISRKYGGTGLGLSIAGKLVALMGGQIGVESRYAEGSTFWFTCRLGIQKNQAVPAGDTGNLQPADKAGGLPVTDGSRGPRRSPRAMAESPAKGIRILLVEDNEMNQQVATELLTAAGFTVRVAENGQQALDMLQAAGSEELFDLVLMDIQMPVMDGYTATKKIRETGRFNDLPVIAMTAHAMSGDHEKSLAAGMNDHITKPIDPDVLYQCLGRWLGIDLVPMTEIPRPHPPEPDRERHGQDLDAGVMSQLLQLKELMAARDMSAREVLASLEETLRQAAPAEADTLIKAVFRFDFKGGITALERLIDKIENRIKTEEI